MIRGYSVRYKFSQHFPVRADKAFDWCTDYQPSDLSLMNESGERRIKKIADDTVLLTETTHAKGHEIRKTKLVRLNRADLSWTNTHVSGPNLHSQFLYRIAPGGKQASILHFTGLLICYSDRALNSFKLREIANNERRTDSKAWRYLAKAMKKDLCAQH